MADWRNLKTNLLSEQSSSSSIISAPEQPASHLPLLGSLALLLFSAEIFQTFSRPRTARSPQCPRVIFSLSGNYFKVPHLVSVQARLGPVKHFSKSSSHFNIKHFFIVGNISDTETISDKYRFQDNPNRLKLLHSWETVETQPETTSFITKIIRYSWGSSIWWQSPFKGN